MVAPAEGLSRSLRSLPLASLGDSPPVRRDFALRSSWEGAAACPAADRRPPDQPGDQATETRFIPKRARVRKSPLTGHTNAAGFSSRAPLPITGNPDRIIMPPQSSTSRRPSRVP